MYFNIPPMLLYGSYYQMSDLAPRGLGQLNHKPWSEENRIDNGCRRTLPPLPKKSTVNWAPIAYESPQGCGTRKNAFVVSGIFRRDFEATRKLFESFATMCERSFSVSGADVSINSVSAASLSFTPIVHGFA